MTAITGAVGTLGGSSLASWQPLYVLMGIFVVVLVVLFVKGVPGEHETSLGRFLLRAPNALERLTSVPGWAAATVGMGLFGLLVAGQGFYSDVAWHVALGRDDDLFTAPHASIFIGLMMLEAAAIVGIMVATLSRARAGFRWAGLQIPWSTLPLGALGLAAVSGFPLDELWHREFGIDVTMWSPTHMLMILGASFSGLASWLVLAEARVRPNDGRWARGLHVTAAWLTLQGLAASQGEFSFGVPQFQQLFHPLLVCLAAGFAIVAMRVVLGPRWALGIVTVSFLVLEAGLLEGGEEGPVDTRAGGVYVVSALCVELIAWLIGTEKKTRFALVSGAAIGTIGLGAEWMWNQRAYQPWNANLLPDALVLGVIASIAAAILGTAFARAVGRDTSDHRINLLVVAGAGLAVLVALALPMSRRVGDVSAAVHLRPVTAKTAIVEATLTPPDAADDARWFQASAWQGGGLVLADMREVAPGKFVSEKPIPTEGYWKSLLRLHRGGEMMTIPIFLPADAAIGEKEISAVDRTVAFESERRYLLRETHSGRGWFALAVHGYLGVAALAWIAAFVLACARIPREGELDDDARSPLHRAQVD